MANREVIVLNEAVPRLEAAQSGDLYTFPRNVAAGGGTGSFQPGGVISVNTTSVGTTAVTSQEDLMTFTLPADTLNANGKGVRVRAWGTTAANGNTKTVRFKFGSAQPGSTAGMASNNLPWYFDILIIREATSDQIAFFVGHWNGVARTPQLSEPTEDETASIIIKVTGQNGTASANDIVQEAMIIEFFG